MYPARPARPAVMGEQEVIPLSGQSLPLMVAAGVVVVPYQLWLPEEVEEAGPEVPEL